MFLVTGSSGHLGEALMRVLHTRGYACLGIDVIAGAFTDRTGSITDRAFVRECMKGITTVLHSATLHKPHIVTHSYQDFIDTNITGTLNLLEEGVAAGLRAFIFTSTTSTFGDVISPNSTEPARWINEDVVPVPKNIYGATKLAAENLCRLFYRKNELPSVILRTSRFFPEEDDQPAVRKVYSSANSKANELLYRRVDIADAVDAHLLAISKAAFIGFGTYIISATTPFQSEELAALRYNAPSVLRQKFPEYPELYRQNNWHMFSSIDRVYDNARARQVLDWQPKYDFVHVLKSLKAGTDFQSELAREVGVKGYHSGTFDDGPYPIE